jgi:Na+/pantothenate symporter
MVHCSPLSDAIHPIQVIVEHNGISFGIQQSVFFISLRTTHVRQIMGVFE